MPDWKRLSSRPLGHYKICGLRSDRLLSPRTGQPVDAYVLESGHWVNVLALTPQQQVVLIRQYRFGTGEDTLEIPGGLVDPGETPFEAAQRELQEETGYGAQRWTPLGSVTPNPAFMTNRRHSFLAEGGQRVGPQQQDPGEDIAVELRPLEDIDALIASGQIHHALVIIAFHKLSLLRAGHTLQDPDPG